jgi:hypothetical protein
MSKKTKGRKTLRFYCVACRGFHVISLRLREDEVGETYEWNGDFERPTVVPAVVVPGKCAVSIRDGVAHYHMTAPHDARGESVALPGVLRRVHA